MHQRLRGGIIGVIGYLLSPLSWWNDSFINIPLAWLFASLLSLVSQRLFLPAMVVGYWLTNIAGMLLLHRGVRTVARDKTAPRGRREVWVNLAVATGYTLLLVVLVLLGVLKPPAALTHR